MSDEAENAPEIQALESTSSDNPKRTRKHLSDEEVYQAIVAVQFNGGNINRTAIALGIPYATLHGIMKEYEAGEIHVSIQRGTREKRGDMAAKLESLIHSAIESAPGKLAKATFSQTMVGVGIGIDKLRMLRGQGLDPDPAAELCRLLNINRSQLPPTLELGPGEEIPPEFSGQVIETQPSPTNPNSFEPEGLDDFIPEAHHPDCLINPNVPDSCSCGADERNQAKLKAQEDEPVN